MGKTKCNVLIINNTRWDMTIHIDDFDDFDWMDGPKTVLDGKVVGGQNHRPFTLCSKDNRSRCWFQMNNVFPDIFKQNSTTGSFHIGMTHIELKTNDNDRQARKATSTEIYTQFNIKVTIDIETPEKGEYKLNIQYDCI